MDNRMTARGRRKGRGNPGVGGGFYDSKGRSEAYIRFRRDQVGKLVPDRTVDGVNLSRIGWRGMKRLTDQDIDKVHELISKGGWHYGVEVLEENPAGPTFSQAMTQARTAGASIGDTSGFEPWLVKAHLSRRGPQVLRHLRMEFEKGVEHGGPTSKASPSAKGIYKTQEGWRVALDPDSLFDSYQDAKRFVESQQKNPRQRFLISTPCREGKVYVSMTSHSQLRRLMKSGVTGLEWFGPASLGSKTRIYYMDDTPENREMAERARVKVRSASLESAPRNYGVEENPSTPWWKRRTA